MVHLGLVPFSGQFHFHVNLGLRLSPGYLPLINRSVERVTRAAWLVILATVVVRVVGLLKEVVVAGSFGVGPAMDAFNVAIAIPYLLAGVVVPAISGAVVPLAAAAELKWGTRAERNRRFWGTLLLVTFVVLFSGVLLVDLLSFGLEGLFAFLSRLMGGTFDADLQVPLIRNLLFIVTPMALLQGLASLEASLFHIRKRFLLPALAPISFSLAMILLLVLHPSPNVVLLAWAALIGNVFWAFALLPYFMRNARPLFKPVGEDIREFTGTLLPLTLVMLFAQSSEALGYFLGISVSVGGAASLGYAQRLVDMPVLLFGAALSVAAFPYLSDSAAEGDLKQLSVDFRRAFGQVALLMAPVTAAWLVLGRQILTSLYKQGAFDEAAVTMTLGPLFMFALGGTFKALSFTQGKMLMAVRRYKALIFFGLSALVINLTLSVPLGRVFGPPGLAASVSISYACVVVGITILTVRVLAPYFLLRPLLAILARAAAAAGGAGVAAAILLSFIPLQSGLAGFGRLFLGGVVLLLLYLLLCRVFGVRLSDVGIMRNQELSG